MELDKKLVDEIIKTNREFFGGDVVDTLYMMAAEDRLAQSYDKKTKSGYGYVVSNIIAELTRFSVRLKRNNEQIYKALKALGYIMEVK